MLLLTQILRPRYRGVIHLFPGDADSRPEIEFSGGEGPEQVMDQVQDFAVPEIRKHVEPLGPYLRWQELDLAAWVVRQHRSSFPDRLEFVLCPDDRGIELVLPAGGGEEGEDLARPWVPLRPLAEPGPEQRATIGWTATAPALAWRYLQTRYAPPAIELTWSCAELPGEWASQVLARAATLDCRLGAGGGGRGDETLPEEGFGCRLNPTRDGLLVYRGYSTLPAGGRRPASWRLSLRQPLVVAGPEVGESRHQLDEEVAATVEALDFRALLDGRPTRLVAGADLDRPFEAEVLTGGEGLLPEEIPPGAIPGLPWTLAVSAPRTGEAASAGSPDLDPGRRWRLTARPHRGQRGTWGEVAWRHRPPAVAFGLGGFDAERAPRITRIDHRRASVGWRIEAADEGGRLCLAVPHWVPVGCPEQLASPGSGGGGELSPRGDVTVDGAAGQGAAGHGFDYAAEVRARLDGLEERFVIDQCSELPRERLLLGPRRWRFRDEAGGAVDGEALGEGAGCVRWRRGEGGGRGAGDTGPTDWAGGSAPVLLVRRGGDVLQWGGLYAPRKVPWDALEEVSPEPAAGEGEILLVPRASSFESRAAGENDSPERRAAIWIDLWGFACRYDVCCVRFRASQDETGEPTAWFAAGGLELFPRHSGYLLRSFSPLYAVRDPEPRVFSLQPGSPRPVLRLGGELDAGRRGLATADLTLEIGGETYVRHQLANPGELPRTFEPGRVPGTRLRFDGIGRKVAWLAVEQRDGGEGRRAGYLLSWDVAAGWRFRGFWAHRDAAAELGEIRRCGESLRVMLGGERAGRTSTFRVILGAGTGADTVRWSAGAPETVRRQLTRESIRRWESHHFAPGRRPAALAGYGLRVRQQAAGGLPWIFELFDGETPEACPPAGIRVWELHDEAGEDGVAGGLGDARALGGARALSDDESAEAPPREPEKRILRADEDDDF